MFLPHVRSRIIQNDNSILLWWILRCKFLFSCRNECFMRLIFISIRKRQQDLVRQFSLNILYLDQLMSVIETSPMVVIAIFTTNWQKIRSVFLERQNRATHSSNLAPQKLFPYVFRRSSLTTYLVPHCQIYEPKFKKPGHTCLFRQKYDSTR